MEIDAHYTAVRFTVSEEVRAQLTDLLSRGTIRVFDNAGTNSYTSEFGLPVLGRDVGIGAVSARDIASEDEILDLLSAQLQRLTRDEAYQVEWIGATDASTLWELIDDLGQWIMVGWAVEEGAIIHG